MPLDMQKELQKTYDKAVMKHEALSLRKGDDWKKQQEIIKRGKIERWRLKKLHACEHKTRVEAERSKLVLALELLRGSNKPHMEKPDIGNPHTNKLCARAEITLVHVDLKTRKSCPPPEAIRAKLAEFRFG